MFKFLKLTEKNLISSLVDMQYLFGINIMQCVFGKKDSSIGGNLINEHRVREK